MLPQTCKTAEFQASLQIAKVCISSFLVEAPVYSFNLNSKNVPVIQVASKTTAPHPLPVHFVQSSRHRTTIVQSIDRMHKLMS